jgi:hypothetical protein
VFLSSLMHNRRWNYFQCKSPQNKNKIVFHKVR